MGLHMITRELVESTVREFKDVNDLLSDEAMMVEGEPLSHLINRNDIREARIMAAVSTLYRVLQDFPVDIQDEVFEQFNLDEDHEFRSLSTNADDGEGLVFEVEDENDDLFVKFIDHHLKTDSFVMVQSEMQAVQDGDILFPIDRKLLKQAIADVSLANEPQMEFSALMAECQTFHECPIGEPDIRSCLSQMVSTVCQIEPEVATNRVNMSLFLRGHESLKYLAQDLFSGPPVGPDVVIVPDDLGQSF